MACLATGPFVIVDQVQQKIYDNGIIQILQWKTTIWNENQIINDFLTVFLIHSIWFMVYFDKVIINTKLQKLAAYLNGKFYIIKQRRKN